VGTVGQSVKTNVQVKIKTAKHTLKYCTSVADPGSEIRDPRSGIRDPGSEIRCFFTPWIRDKKVRDPDPGCFDFKIIGERNCLPKVLF
jgi:hypothetical protein